MKFLNKTFIICITFWLVITLIRLFNHQPWFDEANVWMIAQKASFGQLFLLTKIEGHPFVWYMVIMPFAKLNFMYPYSLLIVNWLFCLGAILTLWKYAPFNNILKCAISFSFPFFALFPIVARCYSISIFILFVLAALFEKKSKHPIIYSILILICANTNAMAMIGSFCFGCFLFFDLIKEKQIKNIIITSVTAVLTALILFLQYSGLDKTYTDERLTSGLNIGFFSNTFIFPVEINIILLSIFVLGFFILLLKSPKAFIFTFICYVYLLAIFEFSYSGNEWHHYFFYIYLIIGVWILLNDNNVTDNIKKGITCLLVILSAFFIIDYRYRPLVFNSHSYDIAKFIENNEQARFILFDGNFLSTIPYFDKSKKYDIYHYQTGLNINETAKQIKHSEIISAEKIHSLMSKNKINYGISDKYFDVINNDKYSLKFEPVKIYPLGYNYNYYIYKIYTDFYANIKS